MKEILERISNYNLFNYLLPGVLFAVIIQQETAYRLLVENTVFSIFICYFVGMIISRVGSLVVEPVLKKIRFIKFKEYKDFTAASQKDQKLDVLSEQNNTYRSLLAMLLLTPIVKGYELLGKMNNLFEEWRFWIILVILISLFLGAYRKQTKYIYKRIEKALE